MSNPDEENLNQSPIEASAAPADADAGASPTPDPESRLDIARRFLEDGTVKDSPREKQVEFLRSKDLTDEEIESLLGPETPSSPPEQPAQPPAQPQAQPQPQPQYQPQYQEPSDRAPIITYPEFLATPRDPPLVTTNALLNTLYALTGLATLLHGVKHYYVDPSLASQTAAREDLSSATSAHLSALVAKLESTVSSLPSSSSPDNDDASSCGDPSELFSRDVGTQTSSAPPTPLFRKQSEKAPTEYQAAKLAALSRSLSNLKEGLDAQAESAQDAVAVADALREQLREASVARTYANMGWRQSEPDDEVKKVKENIRRLKGVFLSTRNFPVSTK